MAEPRELTTRPPKPPRKTKPNHSPTHLSHPLNAVALCVNPACVGLARAYFCIKFMQTFLLETRINYSARHIRTGLARCPNKPYLADVWGSESGQAPLALVLPLPLPFCCYFCCLFCMSFASEHSTAQIQAPPVSPQ